MQKVAVLKKTTLQDRIVIGHAYLYNYYILLNVMKKLNYTSLFLLKIETERKFILTVTYELITILMK